MEPGQATVGEASVFWGVVLAVCDAPDVTVLADCPPEWAQVGTAMVPSLASWPHLLIQSRAVGTPTSAPAGTFTVVTADPGAWSTSSDLSICNAAPVLAAARTALSGISSLATVSTTSWGADARIALVHALENVPTQQRIIATNEIEQQVAEISQQRGIATVTVDLVQEVIARRGRA